MERLAKRLRVTSRHLRRVFTAEFGVSPVAYAQTQRLLSAKRLLTDTDLPITEIAHASGFRSLRRFQGAFRKRYRLAPSDLRRQTERTRGPELVLELGYRPPYAWDEILDFLGARAIAGVETIERRTYLRTVSTGRHDGWIRVERVRGRDVLRVTLSASLVHRVQRVPVTESQGRIHTSTVTVAILPEAEDVEVQIDPSDLRIDIFRSSGPGGQSVNTTDSAVRITHLPTNMVVSCQDEKSQHKNKAKALKILKARLLDNARQEKEKEISAQRKNQVGTGERSERIRTYNFPQGRVTDHRIGLTLYRLSEVLDGEIDEVINKLTTHYQTEALKG